MAATNRARRDHAGQVNPHVDPGGRRCESPHYLAGQCVDALQQLLLARPQDVDFAERGGRAVALTAIDLVLQRRALSLVAPPPQLGRAVLDAGRGAAAAAIP